MELESSYNLLGVVRDDGIRTYRAIEIASGQELQVHLFAQSDSEPDRALFRALRALPVSKRRELLEILTRQQLSAGELSDRFELSRPAVAEHLKVLRDAGLVADEPQGRRRIYRLTAEPLAELGEWLHPFEKFWRGRLAVLAEAAEELE